MQQHLFLHSSIKTLKMLFSKVAAALYLAGAGYAFRITTFSNEGCSGNTQDVNVFDNTCATWPTAFSSFQVTAYGGKNQRAAFYGGDACIAAGTDWTDWWADGGSDTFLKGRCITLPGFTAQAAGSRSA
jgi:hypothetical protein